MSPVAADVVKLCAGRANGKPCDPRSIANLMLEEADRDGSLLTNLAMQKLLYFAHAMFLIENGRPLVSGYFEAWQYGPVHPAAYNAFKAAGRDPIRFRAARKDVLTGEASEVPSPRDSEVCRHVRKIMRSYGSLPPGRLIDISHAKRAPWDYIVSKGRESVAFGLRIPDNVIVERFRHHKVIVGDTPIVGDPGEDSPLA